MFSYDQPVLGFSPSFYTIGLNCSHNCRLRVDLKLTYGGEGAPVQVSARDMIKKVFHCFYAHGV